MKHIMATLLLSGWATSFTKLLYARLQTLGGGIPPSTKSPDDPSEPAKSPILQAIPISQATPVSQATPILPQSLQQSSQNDIVSPTMHNVIHDHPYVHHHMIFSYKTPPPTNQPELVISIPRSSFTMPQLGGTSTGSDG